MHVIFQRRLKTLRRLFDKSKFAISTEETRYYLNGVYIAFFQMERMVEFCDALQRMATA